MEIPRNISFDVYHKKKERKKDKDSLPRSSKSHTQILLQTSQHSSLDYIAQEEDVQGASALKYYVGIFDPTRGDLQLVPAKKLMAQSKVRSKKMPTDEHAQGDDQQENVCFNWSTSRRYIGDR